MALFEEAKELLDISKPVNKAYPRAMAKEDKTRAGQLLRMVPSRFRPPAKNIRVPKGFQVVDNEAPDYEPVSGAAPARGPKRRSSKKASKASAPKAAKSTKRKVAKSGKPKAAEKSAKPKSAKRKAAAKSAKPKAASKRAAARSGEKDPIFRQWLAAQEPKSKSRRARRPKAGKVYEGVIEEVESRPLLPSGGTFPALGPVESGLPLLPGSATLALPAGKVRKSKKTRLVSIGGSKKVKKGMKRTYGREAIEAEKDLFRPITDRRGTVSIVTE